MTRVFLSVLMNTMRKTGIDPIVDEDHFYFQVIQLDGDKEVVVWPSADKEADVFVPDYAK